MKNSLKILCFVLPVFLFIFTAFSGCSEKSSVISYDEKLEGLQILSNTEGDLTNGYDYKYINITVIDPMGIMIAEDEEYDYHFKINPLFLVNVLIDSVERGYNFKNENIRKTFINKLKALRAMIILEKKEPVLNKISEDLIPFGEKWIDENDMRIVGFVLEVIHFLIANDITEGDMYACKQCSHWVWIGHWICFTNVIIRDDRIIKLDPIYRN